MVSIGRRKLSCDSISKTERRRNERKSNLSYERDRGLWLNVLGDGSVSSSQTSELAASQHLGEFDTSLRFLIIRSMRDYSFYERGVSDSLYAATKRTVIQRKMPFVQDYDHERKHS